MLEEVEGFKMKKLLKGLKGSRGGNGTSMVSLDIHPKDQTHRITRMPTDEYGTASIVKSRVNRLGVLGAVTSAHNKLKTYKEAPTNGFGDFVGVVFNEQIKEKKISFGVEPIEPFNISLYMCDSKFHVDVLLALLMLHLNLV